MPADSDLSQIFFSPQLKSSSVRRHLHPCGSAEQSHAALQYFPFSSSWRGPLIQNRRNVPRATRVQARGVVCAR